MRDSDLDRVRNLRLFSSMSEPHFAELTSAGFMQKFPAGTTLLFEGDTVDFLYVLLDGVVEMQGSWNDKETTVSVIRPLSLFILSSVVLDAPALMSARTLERSEILMLSADKFRNALRADGAFSLAVAEELAGWNRAMVRQVKNMKLRSASERLANYLLQLQVQQGGVTTLRLLHEKRILASLLGMTPENLSRAFAALSDYGVEVQGNEVRLTILGALRRMAKPSPYIDNHMPPLDHLGGKAERELWPPNDKASKVIFD
ncbi:cyclic nucleotide-binding domain protein [Asticcacaulis biprosthecium C19]|uniref:Cyclic nucleotide-binding domain protein n=2 Tax=Asticcacaulis biprosthecium TaxID=76891 RepID=F4QTC0_9CAUL|nr:cyclic nucleotide-binding domain protein [Asticcacaulis biprosthecium C19]